MYTTRPCKQADKEHKKSKRQYAHTFHVNKAICLAGDAYYLPDNHFYAILLHELGHLLTDGGNEEEANNIIYQMFGIKIYYIDSKYGEGLEYIKDSDIDKAEEVIIKYIKDFE